MDNRKLTPGEHLASLRRLWKECFNDTDEFIDMYFTRVYSPQVDYSIERGGRVVSALQCLPYNMLCGGNTVLTGYLSGVCTDASYRRQGLAGNPLPTCTAAAAHSHSSSPRAAKCFPSTGNTAFTSPYAEVQCQSGIAET